MPQAEPQEAGPWPKSKTLWPVVAAAAAKNPAAQEAIVNLYRPAFIAHLAGKRIPPPVTAEDIVHEFVQTKILEGHLLEHADAKKGRLRWFLRKALENFVKDKWRRYRDGGVVSLDELDQEMPVTRPKSPSFDVTWAREVIAETLKRAEAACSRKERSTYWAIFEDRVLKPILEGAEPTPYEKLAAALGFKSPTQASNALVTAKRIFAGELRSVVEEYNRDGNLEAEIAELCAILSEGSD